MADENAPPKEAMVIHGSSLSDEDSVRDVEWVKMQQARRRNKCRSRSIKLHRPPSPDNKLETEESSAFEADSTVHNEEWIKKQQALRRTKTFRAKSAQLSKNPPAISDKQDGTDDSSLAESDSSVRSIEWVKAQQALRRQKDYHPLKRFQECKGITTSTPLAAAGPISVKKYFQPCSETKAANSNVVSEVGTNELFPPMGDSTSEWKVSELARGSKDPSVPFEDVALPEASATDAVQDECDAELPHGTLSVVDEQDEAAVTRKTLENTTASSRKTLENSNSSSGKKKKNSSTSSRKTLENTTASSRKTLENSTASSRKSLKNSTAGEALGDPAVAESHEDAADLPEASATSAVQSDFTNSMASTLPDVSNRITAAAGQNEPAACRRSQRQRKPKVICRMCDDDGRHFY